MYPGDWLKPAMSKDQWNTLFNMLQEHYDNGGLCPGPAVMCAQCMCVASLCVLSCPLCYMKYKFDQFQKELVSKLDALNLPNVRFVNNKMATSGVQWLDSNGNPLLVAVDKRGMQPRAPPMFDSIVITMPQQIQWPPPQQVTLLPEVQAAEAKPVVVSPVVVSAPEAQTMGATEDN